MNVTLLKRARRHFVHGMTPRHTARHNMRAWVKSIRMLGDKWLIARPMERRNVGTN